MCAEHSAGEGERGRRGCRRRGHQRHAGRASRRRAGESDERPPHLAGGGVQHIRAPSLHDERARNAPQRCRVGALVQRDTRARSDSSNERRDEGKPPGDGTELQHHDDRQHGDREHSCPDGPHHGPGGTSCRARVERTALRRRRGQGSGRQQPQREREPGQRSTEPALAVLDVDEREAVELPRECEHIGASLIDRQRKRRRDLCCDLAEPVPRAFEHEAPGCVQRPGRSPHAVCEPSVHEPHAGGQHEPVSRAQHQRGRSIS